MGGLAIDPEENVLKAALARSRLVLMAVGVFSFGLNILALATPLYMMQVFDRVLSTGHTATLFYLTLIVLFAIAILSVLDVARAWTLQGLSKWLAAETSGEVLAKSLEANLDLPGFGAQQLRDLKQVQSFLSGSGVNPILDAPWVPIFILVIWVLNPLLGGLALAAAGLLFVLGIWNDRATREAFREGSERASRSLNIITSYVRNAEVARAMGMTSALIARWKSQESSAEDYLSKGAQASSLISGISKFFRAAAQVAVLGIGALLVMQGDLTPGGMIAGSILLGRALAPVEQLLHSWRLFVSARLSYARINELLQRGQAVDKMALPEPKGQISVENVSYKVAQDGPVLIQGVSFAVEPGQALGLIGPSASGKTTLCRLLLGLADPTVGKVRLDGAEISSWSADELGPHIGYLSQNAELFTGTIAENIARMGEPDAQTVVVAAQEANVHEMILRMPQGYDTPIGDQGYYLSAGQKQRIGLARALYGNPKLLVLDEPSSNLDLIGERALQAAIARAKQSGKAIVLVAHRPNALMHMDHVLSLAAGKVQDYGIRDQVLAKLTENARKHAPIKVSAGPKADRGGVS